MKINVHAGTHCVLVRSCWDWNRQKNRKCTSFYLLCVKENEEEAKSCLLYSYKKIPGFSALLTSHEARKLSETEDVVSVILSHGKKYSKCTTRSWQFLGLEEPGNPSDQGNLWLKAKYGKDIIVGMLDNGIWPESESFNDEGMQSVPKSWRGTCQPGQTFNSSNCNKKIIGARYYLKGLEAEYGPLNKTLIYRSARDQYGHGTHTASTATGQIVDNVSSPRGFARGAATGGAPHARLAIYKVDWFIDGGDDAVTMADILSAVDDAIADGVHILSMSLANPGGPVPLDQDPFVIAALYAAKANIAMASAAGNEGPNPATLLNLAPWMITVGLGTLDRIFLSDERVQSLTTYRLEKKLYPLVSADQVINPSVTENESRLCLPDSLFPEKVKGKIVLCSTGAGYDWDRGVEVKRGGGIGIIIGNNEADGNPYLLPIDPHVLPATTVDYTNAISILKYINTTKEPRAYIKPVTTVIGAKPAPLVNTFSSRGPNAAAPHILKPDIIAPGFYILAAVAQGSPSGNNGIVKYDFMRGTSMACPHVAGTMALLKAVHPDWSSAALRSAIMTTAQHRNNEGKPITTNQNQPATPFMYGSGYFNPTKAVDPGLIYNASYTDYLTFLCSIGAYNLTSSFNCLKNPQPPYNLNYPSLAIPDLNGTVTAIRTVTNVGCRGSVYFVKVQPPTVDLRENMASRTPLYHHHGKS